ncbi:Fe-S cluster assembly protein SufD [uncultured Microscilla sp.]|uniref:Fe-S cluster assembly protein SufD n=1 Tax=uncultured Microscilla sp. TaxID=432653 RepID=UPI00261F66BA|nr:Fe-S cluster assembly protein SufD [uncultured Microscilla sp.]
MSTIDKLNLKSTLLEQFKTFENTLNGKSQKPIHKIRQQAIQSFDGLGFPTTKHEEWKYTNLGKVLKEAYAFGQTSPLQKADIEQFFLPNMPKANNIVFVNGVYQPALSQIVSSEDVLVVKNLEEAYDTHTALVEPHFAQLANSEEEALIALNTAFVQDGVFIHVPANKVVEEPTVLYFINDARNENVGVQPRSLIVIEKGAQATFVDKTDTIGGQASFSNAVMEVVVEPNARMTHYKVQNDQPNASYVGTTQVKQASDSYYANTTISLNGGVIRNNLNIALDGSNVESNMFGLYMLTGNTHVDNHSVADHLKPHSLSNELYKGVLDGKSTGVFNGKIFVRQDAQKTNAYQQNRNILLSDNSSINTKPQLEIWADDVKCSHGATTGNLDEEALFYLRSRGIATNEARALLIHAFGNEIVDKIELEPLRIYLENLVMERLEVQF